MCSVQCLCEDRDTFSIFLEKNLGMGIYDPLVFQVSSVSVSPVEYYNFAGVGLLWWCEVANGDLFSKAAYF